MEGPRKASSAPYTPVSLSSTLALTISKLAEIWAALYLQPWREKQ
jgi:hypothetical protein